MHHFLLPVPVEIPLVHGDAGRNVVSYPKTVPGVWGSKALGSEKPLIVQLPDQDIYVAAWYASVS